MTTAHMQAEQVPAAIMAQNMSEAAGVASIATPVSMNLLHLIVLDHNCVSLTSKYTVYTHASKQAGSSMQAAAHHCSAAAANHPPLQQCKHWTRMTGIRLLAFPKQTVPQSTVLYHLQLQLGRCHAGCCNSCRQCTAAALSWPHRCSPEVWHIVLTIGCTTQHAAAAAGACHVRCLQVASSVSGCQAAAGLGHDHGEAACCCNDDVITHPQQPCMAYAFAADSAGKRTAVQVCSGHNCGWLGVHTGAGASQFIRATEGMNCCTRLAALQQVVTQYVCSASGLRAVRCAAGAVIACSKRRDGGVPR